MKEMLLIGVCELLLGGDYVRNEPDFCTHLCFLFNSENCDCLSYLSKMPIRVREIQAAPADKILFLKSAEAN